jgi:hypothetical protein
MKSRTGGRFVVTFRPLLWSIRHMKVCADKIVVPMVVLLFLSFAVTGGAVPVTFQVNTRVQIASGNFDPSVDSVEVRGAFDGWGPGTMLSPKANDTNVYEGTVEVSGGTGSQVQYKFVFNKSGTLVWENNGVGTNGAQNRVFTLPDTAQTLPVADFNNQTVAPSVVPVTFQVNLEIQKNLGNFDPAAHNVQVRGSFDGWSQGLTLAASTTNSNIYKGTVEITGSPGSAVEYKFLIDQAGALVWEGNVGPAGGFGNRVLNLAPPEMVLPVVYFDNLSTDPGAGVAVTFRVNMAVQAATAAFDPASGTMTVAGQFNNWSTTATPLTNSPAEPAMYTGTVNIKAAAGSAVPFKFVADGGTWEMGDNRTFTLQPPSQQLPVLFFNNQNNLGTLSINRVSTTEVGVSWTAAPNIRLQRSSNLASWEDVPNTAGLDSTTVALGSGPVFFRLAGP